MTTQALDRGLNAAILHIADRLFPTGFDVGSDAPASFERLKASLDKPHARLKVFDGGCDGTIYADREVNYCFRAWHDWCHQKLGADFTLAGETRVWQQQCEHLRTLYGDCKTTKRWCEILYAEVIGQAQHYKRHGDYVSDQRGFVDHVLSIGLEPTLEHAW